jgi:hypothetical protein
MDANMWLIYLISGITILAFATMCFLLIIVAISKINDLDDGFEDERKEL